MPRSSNRINERFGRRSITHKQMKYIYIFAMWISRLIFCFCVCCVWFILCIGWQLPAASSVFSTCSFTSHILRVYSVDRCRILYWTSQKLIRISYQRRWLSARGGFHDSTCTSESGATYQTYVTACINGNLCDALHKFLFSVQTVYIHVVHCLNVWLLFLCAFGNCMLFFVCFCSTTMFYYCALMSD